MAADKELFLIDGNSLAYRGFFALPDTIATSQGEPTNAIFGFASMLVKILTEYGPKATIVVWDAGLSGREKAYEAYKSERKPRPDLLKEQWPHFAPLVEAFGYRNVSVKGYEADDVIASLAEQAKAAGLKVMVVTGDRDAYQLPDENTIKVMTTVRGIADVKIYDKAGVVERYGIPPERVTDFIGLKGDKSDNIPGVPGIGDKTAAQLLQDYDSLEGVLEHVDEIKGPKRQQNLRENADLARLSKQLATLDREIDIEIDVEEVAAAEPDRSSLREIFTRWELRDPLRRVEEALNQSGEPVPATVAAPEVAAVEGSLDQLGMGAAALALGGSRDALEWAAWSGEGEALRGRAASLDGLLEQWDPRPLIAHDWKALGREFGAPLGTPVGECRVSAEELAHDTMIAAFLIDPSQRRFDLDELLERAAIGTLGDEAEAGSEAVAVYRLAMAQSEQIERLELGPLLEQIELPLVEVLARMEREGVKLDTYKLGELAAGVGDQIAELEDDIWRLAGEQFTIGSPQQLGGVLFEKLGLPSKKRGKTGPSTDASVLRSIRAEHEIVPKVESWRELSKLKSTYFDALPGLLDDQTGRLHTTFNQAGAATGRLSSTNPNLQNVPVRTELGRRIRSCFVAEPGKALLSADYSQVELRVLAHVAGEQVLKDAFIRGEDIHAATAAEILEISPAEVGTDERARAKAVNFGIIYGQGAFGLSEQLQISRDEADEYIKAYRARFPAVQKFIDDTIAVAGRDGEVRTLFGRRRSLPEVRSSNINTQRLGERLAVNTIIQGTAADVMKIAMVRCDRRLRAEGVQTKLVLTIHDELLFEGPEAEIDSVAKLIVEEMEGAAELDPPLKVDVGVGENWLDAK